MQQRVAIARTLAVRPEIILMDEPFGALDAQTRSDMQQLLLRIWEESASTILFVTHDVEEGIYLADRLFIVSPRPGTIMEDIPISFGRPRDPAVKQTKEFQELVQYILACLRRAPGPGQVTGEHLMPDTLNPQPGDNKLGSTFRGAMERKAEELGLDNTNFVREALKWQYNWIGLGWRCGLCPHLRYRPAAGFGGGIGTDLLERRSSEQSFSPAGSLLEIC